jgi:hypothetical protein
LIITARHYPARKTDRLQICTRAAAIEQLKNDVTEAITRKRLGVRNRWLSSGSALANLREKLSTPPP